MKVIILLGVMIILSIGMSQSYAAHFAKWHMTGFYIGAATGVMERADSQELSFDPSKVRISLYDYSSDKRVTEGPSAILFLGYGKLWNRFYTSGEIAANVAHDSNQLETSDLTINSRRNTVFSAQLRSGYLVKEDWMLYGLCGLARTTFDRSVHFISGGIYNTTKSRGALTLNDIDKSIMTYGPQIGIGFAKFFTEHLSLRLEYMATFYDSDQVDLTDYVYTYNNPKGTYRFNTNTQELNLGISYIR